MEIEYEERKAHSKPDFIFILKLWHFHILYVLGVTMQILLFFHSKEHTASQATGEFCFFSAAAVTWSMLISLLQNHQNEQWQEGLKT